MLYILLRNVMRFLARLFLFEHGMRLLRPTTASWLLSMWFLITLMAAAEGLAWYKVLTVLLPDAFAWAALPLGIAWGLGIWIVDASFVKIDTSPDYSKADGAPAKPASGLSALWRDKVMRGSARRCAPRSSAPASW